MLNLAKNLKENIFQYVSTFAGEADKSKTYLTISDLETDIANKLLIYPGKIVYVFETKQFYLIDLKIDGNNVYPENILSEWITHINNLNGKTDFSSIDYELNNYTNEWYYETAFTNAINIPLENGKSILSKNGEIQWIVNEIIYNNDISYEFDTTITSFDLLNESIKIYLAVIGKNTLNNDKASYVSNLILSKNGANAEFIEYGVLNSNNLDITFNCFLNTNTNKWDITLQKNSNDIIVNNILMKIQIVNFI